MRHAIDAAEQHRNRMKPIDEFGVSESRMFWREEMTDRQLVEHHSTLDDGQTISIRYAIVRVAHTSTDRQFGRF